LIQWLVVNMSLMGILSASRVISVAHTILKIR
jgi:hypothetical protein